MARLRNNIGMSCATVGTGNATLGTALPGYLAFVSGDDGLSFDYSFKDGSNAEQGTGTYTHSTKLFTRTVTASTNGGAAISLSGSAKFYVSPRAETLNDASLITGGTFAGARLGSGTLDISTALCGDQVFRKGARVLLATLTAANSASLSDTTTFTTYGSLFDDFEIVIENLIPSTDQVHLICEVSSGGAFKTSGYLANMGVSASTAFASVAQTTSFFLSGNNTVHNTAAAGGLSGTYRLYKPVQTASPKFFLGQSAWEAGNTAVQVTGQTSGKWDSTAALDGIRAKAASGNLLSGVMKIYGLS